jgi:hypothetical protein
VVIFTLKGEKSSLTLSIIFSISAGFKLEGAQLIVPLVFHTVFETTSPSKTRRMVALEATMFCPFGGFTFAYGTSEAGLFILLKTFKPKLQVSGLRSVDFSFSVVIWLVLEQAASDSSSRKLRMRMWCFFYFGNPFWNLQKIKNTGVELLI